MREIRTSGSEGGVRFKPSFLPLSKGRNGQSKCRIEDPWSARACSRFGFGTAEGCRDRLWSPMSLGTQSKAVSSHRTPKGEEYELLVKILLFFGIILVLAASYDFLHPPESRSHLSNRVREPFYFSRQPQGLLCSCGVSLRFSTSRTVDE